MEQRIIELGFNILNQLKLFHWATKSYSTHTAIGELYDSVAELHDNLVECQIGHSGKPLQSFQISTLSESTSASGVIVQYLKETISVLRKLRSDIKTSELQNIIDEMISAMDKTCYLLMFTQP